METCLSQNQESLVQKAVLRVRAGYEARTELGSLLQSLFPSEDSTFLDYWAGFCYVQFRNSSEPSKREWILRNMVSEVSSGSAHTWYSSYLRERERKSVYVY